MPQIDISTQLATIVNGAVNDGSPVNSAMVVLQNAINALDSGKSTIPALVSTPPGSPVDGQEIYYAIDGSQGIQWHLRWRAGTSRWDLLGGTPMFSEVDAGGVDGTASVFSDLAGGPQITVPRAGDYDIEFGCNVTAAPSIAFVFQTGLNINGVSPPADLADVVAGPNPGGATVGFHLHRRVRRTLAASAVLKQQYLVVGSPATFGNRYLRLRPFRIQ